MWSQMHGNETTTTIALLDFISWVLKPEQSEYLKFLVFIIPQLNLMDLNYIPVNFNGAI